MSVSVQNGGKKLHNVAPFTAPKDDKRIGVLGGL